MFSFAAIALLGLPGLIILWPIVKYFWDVRGFRKYPVQNFFSGFTCLAYNWEMGRNHSVTRTRRLHELHQKKGAVIRLAPNWLSFSNAAAVQDIYGHKSPLLKNEVYIRLQEHGRHLGNVVNKSYHADRRRLVATYYAPRNIESWEPKIVALAATLATNVDQMCTSPLEPGDVPPKKDVKFNGNRWGLMFAMESVSRIGLSTDLGLVERGSDAFEIVTKSGSKKTILLIDSLRGYYGEAATLIWDSHWYPLLKVLSGALSSRYAKAWVHGDDWRAFLNKLVQDRITRYDNGEFLNDLFQPMIENEKTGDQPDISLRDKVAEMDQMCKCFDKGFEITNSSRNRTAVNGAIDGTGSSLVNTLYYLLKHPEAMQRVRAELDAVLSPEDFAVSYSKVKHLQFLKASITEASRLSPPVAGDLPRKVPSNCTHTVAGVTVPSGTDCSISAYTAQRDPDIFPDPEAFRPERWLNKGEEQLKRMTDVYLVFTAGSRMCMGKSVTILVQSVYLATLLHRYEFAFPSSDWELPRSERFNLWAGDMPLKVWRRQLATADRDMAA